MLMELRQGEIINDNKSVNTEGSLMNARQSERG